MSTAAVAGKPIAYTAKVMAKGQITIPKALRVALHLDEGNNVTIVQQGDKLILENSANQAMAALRELQEAMKGEAERLGLRNEDDVVAMIKEVRRDRARAARENSN
jgi:AbrB family looped-hinge helix DNA binding protein